jgi:hypothetical protein
MDGKYIGIIVGGGIAVLGIGAIVKNIISKKTPEDPERPSRYKFGPDRNDYVDNNAESRIVRDTSPDTMADSTILEPQNQRRTLLGGKTKRKAKNKKSRRKK